MFTDEERVIVKNVLEKKRLNPNYKPSFEENKLIDDVLQSSIDSIEDVSAINQAIFQVLRW